MSDVKRLNFTVSQFESVVPYASEHGQYVRFADYAKLEAEAQALREQLAALRARVVVLPSVDSVMNIVMRYQWNEKTNVTGTTNWAANLGMKVVDEVKRLNGKAVSEGLLRRLSRADTDGIMWSDCEGLRELLGDEKESGS